MIVSMVKAFKDSQTTMEMPPEDERIIIKAEPEAY